MDHMMSSMMRDPFQQQQQQQQDDDYFNGGGGGGGLPALTAGPQHAVPPHAVVPQHGVAPHPQPGALARRTRPPASPFGALGIPSIANMMTSMVSVQREREKERLV